jgi:hypothetical protein
MSIVVSKIQSKKTQEFHQENQEKPIIHQQTILEVVNGVADHQKTVTTTASTPVSSPKPTRKSIAPRFVSPLNGKIVDQGADVILDAIVDGKCICQLFHITFEQHCVLLCQ